MPKYLVNTVNTIPNKFNYLHQTCSFKTIYGPLFINLICGFIFSV